MLHDVVVVVVVCVGVVDLIHMVGYTFGGENGLDVSAVPLSHLPEHIQQEAAREREVLIERVADADESLMEKYVLEEPIGAEELHAAIRRATIARTFCPVMMGSAYKNKGVQLLLDGVRDFLPSPLEGDSFLSISIYLYIYISIYLYLYLYVKQVYPVHSRSDEHGPGCEQQGGQSRSIGLALGPHGGVRF
jgi:translation elongation factor EF-G